MPLRDWLAPPFQAWPSARPSVRSVPGPVIFERSEVLAGQPVRRSCRRALCSAQAATGSGRSMRVAAKIASASLPTATSSGSSGKHLLGPRRAGIGHDGPVDVEVDDLAQRRLVGLGHGAVGAADLVGVLLGEQHRVVAGDGEARGVVVEGLGDALIEPAGGAVEARVVAVAVARERHLLVGKDGGHEAGAGLVGVLGDLPRQRQGAGRRGHVEVLPRLEAEADLDGDFGELVEFCGIDGERAWRHLRVRKRGPKA